MKITNIIWSLQAVRGFKMKTFVKRIIMKVLDVLSRPIKASQWYRSLFVDFDHELYPDNVWYRNHDERNFEVVNLGSSAAKLAFDWSAIHVKGMNWAQQPQTLIDDFRLLKNFHSILKKNGTVIITIMPFSGLNKQTGMRDTLKYLGTLYWDVAQGMPYLAEATRIRNYPILLGKPAIKAGVRHLLRKERKDSPAQRINTGHVLLPDEFDRDADRWMKGWANQFGIADFEAPLTPQNITGRQTRVKVMRELVDFCRKRGYRAVYVIPPVATPLAERFTKTFRKLYIEDFLNDVARDVKLLNYLDDNEFRDATLYLNSFFLNQHGCEKFTKRVWEDIQ